MFLAFISDTHRTAFPNKVIYLMKIYNNKAFHQIIIFVQFKDYELINTFIYSFLL